MVEIIEKIDIFREKLNFSHKYEKIKIIQFNEESL
jgi:hypothetical protein